ncbi:uncharacterized protein LOC18429449 [Amborella trichopoda]|uniref:Caprin-1 dimerization domain-containing protein n=1 Tax=Amborella trichopoda TaxID=13333 RepID=W1NUR0_AMBTC|nr:uncharacterized protein LOC18429449 [Amborella trichopoda]ERN01367.1 hypothetical protein AMTR_s00002p00260390 [Amborella trichopoda]|eukprot:XP_006838798.1 uncharacterized protein LOC18429449 [Amborella trichopoda]
MAVSEAAATATSIETCKDGPVLSMMSKRLRALKKKYNRILQIEESRSQGKSIIKEQEEVLRSKPGVLALIEEYEKLRVPLSNALKEELSSLQPPTPSPPPPLPQDNGTSDKKEKGYHKKGLNHDLDEVIEDLLKLLYFGSLFDVKSQNEFTSIMLTRVHERSSCLTYDYVTDDATDLLVERDLDFLSVCGSLMTARPPNSTLSHKEALRICVDRAKLWLHKSDEPLYSDVGVTYAGLRERLNKILSSEYFTTTPEMKALSQQSAVEAAAAAASGNYVPQVIVQDSGMQDHAFETESAPTHHQQKAEGQENHAIHSNTTDPPQEHSQDNHEEEAYDPSEDGASNSLPPPPQELDTEEDQHREAEPELKEHHQYVQKRGYPNPNQRVMGRGGGRRGGYHGNVRGGGRVGRGANGYQYQNGRGSQFYDHGNSYYPRNYYNGRGRGGRGGGVVYSNHGGPQFSSEEQ